MPDWSSIDVPDEATRTHYREQGWWRDETFVDDLVRWATERPDHPAVVSARTGRAREVIGYAALLEHVERYAAALQRLGVRRGDVVLLWLPNTWELSALYLACARIGALSSPVLPLFDQAEAAHAMRVGEVTVCVTVDHYQGRRCAELLREVAPASVRAIAVLTDPLEPAGPGEHGTSGPPLVDFDAEFRNGPLPEPGELADPIGPDDPAVVIYSSGTSGRKKGAVHTQNTITSAVRSTSVPHALGPDDVIFLPGYQSHMAGMTYGIYQALHLGATNVVLWDNHDADRVLEEVAENRVTWLYAAPSFVAAAVAEQLAHPRDTSALVRIVTGSAPVQPRVVDDVRRAFGVPLHSLWGMTENGAVTVTMPDDPADWATCSDGRAMPWMQTKVVAVDGADGGRLLVRGANQCLGYLGQRADYEACLEDGWFDTGDLARDDGRGGIRIVGRRSDLINRSMGWMVSVLEAEGTLVEHPRIKDVAVVGYPDPAAPACDLVCAVVVPEGTPVTLGELHEHLAGLGISDLQWPDRVQFVWELPRNSIGKVLREPLRRRLELEVGR